MLKKNVGGRWVAHSIRIAIEEVTNSGQDTPIYRKDNR